MLMMIGLLFIYTEKSWRKDNSHRRVTEILTRKV